MKQKPLAQRLAAVGLKVTVSRDIDGHLFVVTDSTGARVAHGWSRGAKRDALDEVASHPAVKARLQEGGSK